MSSITIRKLEKSLERKLRERAALHGRTMEEEAREILRAALLEDPVERRNLFDAIRRRVDPLGGVDLEIPPREPIPKPRL